ncbi:ABC transporter permease [Actinoallomurus spadix]|uniref:ABC transporter permease subunit n=1 Tax=Actinoallomurus spadix TaxID=79912 RepID=A0ABN0WDR3_9ACTN|nr:ABC transporter permease [Actinoallomurus spadix]MCO5987186.1 ABC transporter permease [Actinoallomurus spadix]
MTITMTDDRTRTRARGGLRGAIAAEWTKLWSVRSTWWCLLSAGLVMAAACAQLAVSHVYDNTHADRPHPGVLSAGDLAIEAVTLVQVVIIAPAMLMITSEYSTGSIRSTLLWTPVRHRMLLAKVTVLAPVMFAVGTALALAGAAVADPMMGRWGTFPVTGVAAAALRVGVYTAVVAAFTLGAGAVLRSAVGTLTCVFLLLMVVPALLGAAGGAGRHVADALPSIAGQHFMATDAHPYGPAAGLAVTAVWAVAALLAGVWTLHRRDA